MKTMRGSWLLAAALAAMVGGTGSASAVGPGADPAEYTHYTAGPDMDQGVDAKPALAQGRQDGGAAPVVGPTKDVASLDSKKSAAQADQSRSIQALFQRIKAQRQSVDAPRNWMFGDIGTFHRNMLDASIVDPILDVASNSITTGAFGTAKAVLETIITMPPSYRAGQTAHGHLTIYAEDDLKALVKALMALLN